MVPATKKSRPKAAGIFALRPLEFAAWLVLVAVLAGITLSRYSSELNASPAALATARIDLNTAPVDELKTLPGMSARHANAIVHARETKGRFTDVHALLKVPGITAAYLSRIEELVEVKE